MTLQLPCNVKITTGEWLDAAIALLEQRLQPHLISRDRGGIASSLIESRFDSIAGRERRVQAESRDSDPNPKNRAARRENGIRIKREAETREGRRSKKECKYQNGRQRRPVSERQKKALLRVLHPEYRIPASLDF